MSPVQSLHLPLSGQCHRSRLGSGLARRQRAVAFPDFERIHCAVSARNAQFCKTRKLVLYPAELRGLYSQCSRYIIRQRPGSSTHRATPSCDTHRAASIMDGQAPSPFAPPERRRGVTTMVAESAAAPLRSPRPVEAIPPSAPVARYRPTPSTGDPCRLPRLART